MAKTKTVYEIKPELLAEVVNIPLLAGDKVRVVPIEVEELPEKVQRLSKFKLSVTRTTSKSGYAVTEMLEGEFGLSDLHAWFKQKGEVLPDLATAAVAVSSAGGLTIGTLGELS